MGYFTSILNGGGGGGAKPAEVKPHKVSLYATRDIIDPSVNLARRNEIAPFAGAAAGAATMAANELARPASGLFAALDAQAQERAVSRTTLVLGMLRAGLDRDSMPRAPQSPAARSREGDTR